MPSPHGQPSAALSRPLEPIPLPPLSAEPLVSVLMTSFNYADHIGGAIESVLAQTYRRFEVLVCDDGSTDESAAVIEGYAARDPRVRLVQQANGGEASATMGAYRAATGEIVCLMDSDDVMLPEKLAKVVAAFRTQPTVGTCLHLLLPVSTEGTPIGKPMPIVLEEGWLAWRLLRTGLLGGYLATSGLSYRQALLDRILPLPDEFVAEFAHQSAPVDTYTLAVARFLAPITTIPEVLAHYRFHGGNTAAAIAPTPKTLGRATEHLATIFRYTRHFLAGCFGERLVVGVDLLDYPVYAEHLLALYLLSGKPAGGVFGHRPAQIMRHLPPGRRRRFWRLLLALPAPLSAWVVANWWGLAPWKRWLRPLWRRLGVSD